MSEQKHGLGRGLDALFGDENEHFDLNQVIPDEAGNKLVEQVNVALLVARKDQPREDFDEESLIDLTESIRQKGILQPILVRPKNNFLEIIAGERRYRAALKAGLQMVPVIKKDLSDAEAFEIALIENMVRQNLNPMEEAAGFDRLIKEYGYTHEDLSKSIRKSRSYITNSLRLLDLPLSVQKMVSDKRLSVGHAKVLVGLQNAEDIAQKVIDKDLSVRQTEELTSRIKSGKKSVAHRVQNEDLRAIEKRLTQSLNVKAKISFNDKGKGKIVLTYNNFTELENLLNKLEK